MRICGLGVAVLFSFVLTPCFAVEREIAITIDDLPFVGSPTNTPANLKRTQERFAALINALVTNHIPATGFAIGEKSVTKSQWDMLETFRKQGFALGNHTYTHKSLNSTNTDKYIADVDRADKLLTPVMTTPKYFRFPYLAEGVGEKKQKVRNYLDSHNYTIAPVTIDSKDYEFNARFYRIAYRNRMTAIHQFKKGYLAFIWKQTLKAEKSAAAKSDGRPTKHILLLHANLLNSLCLEDIIKMYQQNGYKFISLAEALDGKSAPTLVNKTPMQSVIPAIPKEASLEKKMTSHLMPLEKNIFWDAFAAL